jgi:predicted dehydrogenase
LTPVRFGILGAAHVAPSALVWPARAIDGAEVVAVAARSWERASAFAREHDIPDAEPTYEALLARDDLDAIYIALPASAHRTWAGAALESGKHVLCEKPLALDADEARVLVEIAERAGLGLAEAYHYRHHPYMARICEVVASGELGAIRRIEAAHKNWVPAAWPVYWSRELGGGSTLHTGCYPVHCVRSITGEEPVVTAAEAEWVEGVDAALAAELRFPSGITGLVESSMVWTGDAENWVRVVGSDGVLHAGNFIVPHFGERVPSLRAELVVKTGTETREESFGGPPTYDFQLRAFVDAVRGRRPVLTGGADSVATMTVIDAMLAAARGGG